MNTKTLKAIEQERGPKAYEPLAYEVLHLGPEPVYAGDGAEHIAAISRRQKSLAATLNQMHRSGYRLKETRGEFAIFEKRRPAEIDRVHSILTRALAEPDGLTTAELVEACTLLEGDGPC